MVQAAGAATAADPSAAVSVTQQPVSDLPTPLGTIITFYSWKGGVGRTMALANTAVQLARAGRSVLMIDWDLEAPGLDQYFLRPGKLEASLLHTTPAAAPSGLMGLLDAAMQRGDGQLGSDELHAATIRISVPPSEPTSSASLPPTPNLLHLIPAGQDDADYAAKLSAQDRNDTRRAK